MTQSGGGGSGARVRAGDGPGTGPGSFAFATIGAFSGINAKVLPLLQEAFPQLRSQALDVPTWERSDRRVLVANAAYVLAEHGPRPFLDRTQRWVAFHETSYIFRRIRRRMGELADGTSPAFTFQTQSLFDASIPGVPNFVYTDHTSLAASSYAAPGSEDAPSARWLEREREIYANAALVFTMSSHVSRSVAEDYGIDPGKVRCVYAGSNVDAIPEPAGGHDYAGRRILFIGRDWERKGGPDLLDAFRLVRRELPDATLVVGGCRPAVTDEGVTVLGELGPAEVSAQLHRASVFCMPTRREPFGVAFVEALKHGVPVVAPGIGALPDLVQPGETGELTRPGDVRAIADALLGLLTDPERGRRFGTLGRVRMEARYTWPRAVGAMAAQIGEITGMAVAVADGAGTPVGPPG